MVSKLVFKGDKKKKTKSGKSSGQSAGISKPSSGPKRSSKDAAAVTASASAAAETETVWSSAKNAAQITGPVVLTIVSIQKAIQLYITFAQIVCSYIGLIG
jgi:hypothetical protein